MPATPTDLLDLARRRYGDERAAELIALAALVQAGLEVVAAADLGGQDEPDFLDEPLQP